MLTLIAALSLFGLLVLAALVATAVAVHTDGYDRRPPRDEVHGPAEELPWAPYRDVRGAPRPW